MKLDLPELDSKDIELFQSRLDANELSMRSKYSLIRMLRYVEDNIESFSIAERRRMESSLSRIIRDNI